MSSFLQLELILFNLDSLKNKTPSPPISLFNETSLPIYPPLVKTLLDGYTHHITPPLSSFWFTLQTDTRFLHQSLYCSPNIFSINYHRPDVWNYGLYIIII